MTPWEYSRVTNLPLKCFRITEKWHMQSITCLIHPCELGKKSITCVANIYLVDWRTIHIVHLFLTKETGNQIWVCRFSCIWMCAVFANLSPIVFWMTSMALLCDLLNLTITQVSVRLIISSSSLHSASNTDKQTHFLGWKH